MILNVPTLKRTRVALPAQKDETLVQESTLQESLSIPKITRFVVPTVPNRANSVIKKQKRNAKRWNDFQRQAARRGKFITLVATEHAWLIAQPCLYCNADGKLGLDRARNNESYTRENSVPCCGPYNMERRKLQIADNTPAKRTFTSHTNHSALHHSLKFACGSSGALAN